MNYTLTGKQLWINLLCMLLAVNLYAGKEIFMQAEKLYSEKKYAEALQLYQSLENEKTHSAILYYNMGNCHYKMQNIANAIWYYEKALKLNPDDPEIKKNLEFANQKIRDNIPLNDSLNLNNWIISFSSFFTSNTWAWLSFLFIILFWINLLIVFYNQKLLIKRLSLNSVFVCTVFAFVCWYFSYASYKHYTQHTHGIIFQSTAEIKTEPNEKSNTAFILHEGSKVKLEEKKNNWYKISLDENKKGWLQENYLKQI